MRRVCAACGRFGAAVGRCCGQMDGQQLILGLLKVTFTSSVGEPPPRAPWPPIRRRHVGLGGGPTPSPPPRRMIQQAPSSARTTLNQHTGPVCAAHFFHCCSRINRWSQLWLQLSCRIPPTVSRRKYFLFYFALCLLTCSNLSLFLLCVVDLFG